MIMVKATVIEEGMTRATVAAEATIATECITTTDATQLSLKAIEGSHA